MFDTRCFQFHLDLRKDSSGEDSNQPKSRVFNSATSFREQHEMEDCESTRRFTRYEMTTLVARGGFGDIISARDGYGKSVTIKRIRLDTEARRKKLHRELEVLKLSRGRDGIVQLVDFLESVDVAHLVLETAHSSLMDRLLADGPYAEEAVAEAIGDVAAALDFLHGHGIAHRDLKPENLLCFSRWGINPLKICDFDLCSYSAEAGQQQRSEFKSQLGTVDYMAPEVASVWLGERESYEKESDLWSLGAILYVIFFRKSLFAYPSFAGCPLRCQGECDDCERIRLKIVQKGNYVVPPEMSKLSEAAVEVTLDLLRIEPQLRLTASRILQHRWIVRRVAW